MIAGSLRQIRTKVPAIMNLWLHSLTHTGHIAHRSAGQVCSETRTARVPGSSASKTCGMSPG
jgi:hypothetical protein